MHHEINRNMCEKHANHVAVLVRTVFVKTKPVARNFDQTPEQESPFWSRGTSQESFRCGCGGGCHNLCLILLADGDAVAQRKQNWVELLRCVDRPGKFLNALFVKDIRLGRYCRFSRPQLFVGKVQSVMPENGPCHDPR